MENCNIKVLIIFGGFTRVSLLAEMRRLIREDSPSFLSICMPLGREAYDQVS